jgi:arylsulfatase A-like enzyme
MRTSILALTVMVLTVPASLHAAPASAEKPNILIILADDLGYADLGFQGSQEVPTPYLDALAKSGVRCTSGYVTHPFCSPTRAGLLTGRYQQRFGHEFNPVYDPLDLTEGLPLNERLLPQSLKEAGYKTGWVGKWHLGSSPRHSPWNRGFDETFGFIGGGHRFLNWTPNEHQYTLPIMRNGRPVEVQGHLTTAFSNEASSFVHRHSNSGAPWLLYLAFNAPHTPLEPTAERERRFAGIEPPERRKAVAQISLLDDAVGTVLEALADSGQAGNTLVFFFSDNGGPRIPASASKNGPLRGTKGQLFEGGVRVPFVVSWPGHLPAGTTYDDPVSSLDVFATAVALAGIPVPAGTTYDGVNLIPHLAGTSKTPPHDRLFWRTSGGQARAVREGRWKLLRLEDGPAQLFDLATDLGESTDRAASNPEVAHRLAEALEAWDKQLIPPAFLGSSVKNEDWGPGGANQKGKPGGVTKPKSN